MSLNRLRKWWKQQRVKRRIWELSLLWANSPELMAQIQEMSRPSERSAAPDGCSTTTSTG